MIWIEAFNIPYNTKGALHFLLGKTRLESHMGDESLAGLRRGFTTYLDNTTTLF